MSEKLITIKESHLNNHCPECFGKSLRIVFKQKFVETKLYKSITSDTVPELYCENCENTIYPVQWTNDIEQVFNYHQRAFKPKKTSFKLKRNGWLLIISGIVILIAAILIPFLLLRK